MIVVGLTGSIGMGKSTTAEMFRDEGIPVNDADAVVHQLYAGKAAPLIEAAFPGTTQGGIVNRAFLSKALADNPAGFKTLEAIVHPLVRAEELAFREKAERSDAEMIVLDIPLLFEAGGASRVDKIVVVSCDPEIQRRRVLERPGMTAEKFEMIVARQTPDAEKRARADFVIDTGQGLEHARRQVKHIIAQLREKKEIAG